MSRVLFVAYHFPPIGGAGVQRSVKFVRHLPSFGYKPVVITGPGEPTGRWTPVDETLSSEVPPEVDVVRIPSSPPPSSGRWRTRAERWLDLPRPFSRWWVEEAVAAGSRQDVDLVCASMAPYESGEAAARIAGRLGRPWVADLRDPWALDEMLVYPTRFHRRRELRRMIALLARADGIIMNTPEAARRVSSFRELAGKRIVSIPNGFDAEDFSGPPQRRSDGVFRIVHAGYLHTDLGRSERDARRLRRVLGGSVGGVDILTRSHVFLLQALERLVAEEPELEEAIELQLAGVASPGDREAGGGSRIVRFLGYLPHRETVSLLRSADLLFLPMHDLPPGVRAGIVPGKTYEYLAAGRPILAAVPDGDARDLLTKAGNAHLCRPADIECMARAVRAELARFRRGEGGPSAPARLLAPYERRALTKRLAETFDEVLERDPARVQPRRSPRRSFSRAL